MSNISITQPTLFIPHGAGPCFFMDWQPSGLWSEMESFLKNVSDYLPERPKAILLVSAHWQTESFNVTTGEQPELIYDYHGFPEHTYKLTYPAPGSPQLAQQVIALLTKAGLPSQKEPARGFDHGMFIPLKLMFPEANIPVVQLSLRNDLDPEAHIAAGKALESLRKEGVLIVGSGLSFHNMRAYGDANFTAPSQVFDQWLTKTVEAESKERVSNLSRWSHAPQALKCHPMGEEEHLIPLMVVAGAAGKDVGDKIYSEQIITTQVSAFRFG